MADRGASATVITEIGKSQNRPFHLMQILLDSGTVYITDGFRAVTWGGNTYLAAGYALGFDGLEETTDVRIPQVSASLSGVDQVWIANMLLNTYIDRKLKIYKAFFDSTDAVIVDPIALFDGLMDSPVVDEDPASGKCTVTIVATSRGGDFDRLPGRHTNDVEQQLLFPGDLGFQYVSGLNTQIIWGAPGDSSVPAQASGVVFGGLSR